MEILEPVQIHGWADLFPAELSYQAAKALESGEILFAPNLGFELSESEQRFLSPECLSGKSKNIRFNPQTEVLGGTAYEGTDREGLTAMVRRFSTQATTLLRTLCQAYEDQLTLGLTSFRPAEISGRVTSWRKDDTRLHVDAFPSRPSQGRRILRVFANVNSSVARVWRVGEPFEQAARTLLPRIRPPLPGSFFLLSLFKITKGRRTLYDHYMLGLHDAMKADARYQAEAPQTVICFPPGAVWVCFTDSVSHAATSSHHVLEQTFYLPVSATCNPSLSPLRVLEKLLGRTLL